MVWPVPARSPLWYIRSLSSQRYVIYEVSAGPRVERAKYGLSIYEHERTSYRCHIRGSERSFRQAARKKRHLSRQASFLI
jgi:hypothetical protein